MYIRAMVPTLKKGKKMKKEKRDIPQEQTDNLIKLLETANPNDFVLPWHNQANKGMPKNSLTKKTYSGQNTIALWVAQEINQYPSNLWATYNQWFELGGGIKEKVKGKWQIIQKSKYNVRKGEKCSHISVPIPCNFDKEMDNVKTGETEIVHVSFTKFRTAQVFNAAQIEGFEIPETKKANLAESVKKADMFFGNLGIEKREQSGRAYYSHTHDYYSLPPMDEFINTKTSNATETYYSTESHEVIHATGHAKRLGRAFKSEKQSYAFEELVAECGAAFLCAHLEISSETRVDHAQYLAHWIAILKKDKTAIQRAASLASKAYQWTLDQQHTETKMVA